MLELVKGNHNRTGLTETVLISIFLFVIGSLQRVFGLSRISC